MTMTSTGAAAKVFAAHSPPKPAPTMTTRGAADAPFSGMGGVYAAPAARPSRLFRDQPVLDRHGVEAGGVEHLERVIDRVQNRLAHDVEAGVEEQRHAGELVEFFQERTKARVRFLSHALQPAGAIGVHYRRHEGALLLAKAQRALHVRRGLVVIEPVRPVLGEDRRGERPERLAQLHLGVYLILGVWRGRGGEDRAVAERARPELGP